MTEQVDPAPDRFEEAVEAGLKRAIKRLREVGENEVHHASVQVRGAVASELEEILAALPATEGPNVLSKDEARLMGGYEDRMTVAELEAKNAIRKRLRDFAGEEE